MTNKLNILDREEKQDFGYATIIIYFGILYNNFAQVFLEYSDATGCTKAKSALSGRKFGGNTVMALYYPEDKYYGGDYAAWLGIF